MNHQLRRALIALVFAGIGVGGCGGGDEDPEQAGPVKGESIAVIGDTPYGREQVANFRRDIAQINEDPRVRLVIHLGDIQEGQSRCEDRYLERIRRDCDTLADPLGYTPGDNEWTDCHQPDKGGLDPAQRLAKLRSVFFKSPGRTLGRRPRRVEAQGAPFGENVRWIDDGTVFTTLHVPGSNNGLVPWSDAIEDQMRAHRARLRADLAWLDKAFDVARQRRARAVVVAMQADMWPEQTEARDASGYEPIVAKLARRARAFRRPVLVLQGDSHRFKFDYPLREGSPTHGVTTRAPNVIRVVVQGADSMPREWLRLNVSRTRGVFTWDRRRLEP